MALVKLYDKRTTVSKNSKEVYYSDFHKSFAVHPEKHDLSRVVNESSIVEALKNLVLTQRGERFFNPDFGTDVNSLLFELVSPITMDALHTVIRAAIENFEPRVKIVSLEVRDEIDSNSFLVILTYMAVNQTKPVTVQFLLNRVR